MLVGMLVANIGFPHSGEGHAPLCDQDETANDDAVVCTR
jgi:hypothetical protein